VGEAQGETFAALARRHPAVLAIHQRIKREQRNQLTNGLVEALGATLDELERMRADAREGVAQAPVKGAAVYAITATVDEHAAEIRRAALQEALAVCETERKDWQQLVAEASSPEHLRCFETGRDGALYCCEAIEELLREVPT